MGDRANHPALSIAAASAAIERGDLAGALNVLVRVRSRSPRVAAAIARIRNRPANQPCDAELSTIPGDSAAVANALRDLEAALDRYAKRAANAR